MEDMIENLFVKSNGLVGVLLKCVQKRDNLMLHTFFLLSRYHLNFREHTQNCCTNILCIRLRWIH